ncbi:hypothetical protein FNV43_RR19029 [Rhamnella rubrinervis]|uniref:Uncharacterized protein n=1 Tax=Rhamnella rubrinervis TaxID=2594499 RepID=A0A8K0GWV8_9ROSA|nr:hypothetical protein FNV43_RR19029 [Rhamnella rubrinervis]
MLPRKSSSNMKRRGSNKKKKIRKAFLKKDIDDLASFFDISDISSLDSSNGECEQEINVQFLLSRAWSTIIHGNLMLQLIGNLKAVKSALKHWSKFIFDDINLKISIALSKVQDAQNDIATLGFTKEKLELRNRKPKPLLSSLMIDDDLVTDKNYIQDHIMVTDSENDFLVSLPDSDAIEKVVFDACTMDKFRPIVLGVSLFDKKVFGGNVALKINIRKAFDTFSDPLWPLLFGLAKDFLSWYISSLVQSNSLSPMLASQEVYAPSHLLYVEDGQRGVNLIGMSLSVSPTTAAVAIVVVVITVVVAAATIVVGTVDVVVDVVIAVKR